jgi:uncharacterized protein
MTFRYSWLSNHTGGCVLVTIVSHAAQGTITVGGFWSAGAGLAQATLLYAVVVSAVALGLVAFDREAWRGPAAAATTRQPRAMPPGEAAPAAPA